MTLLSVLFVVLILIFIFSNPLLANAFAVVIMSMMMFIIFFILLMLSPFIIIIWILYITMKYINECIK